MNSFWFKALTLILALLPTAHAFAQEPLTLQAAIERALARNTDIAVAKARLAESEATRFKATTAFLPNIQAVGQYTHNSVEATFDFGALITRIAPPGLIDPTKLPGPSIIQKQDTVSGALTVDETIFALSPILLRSAASQQVEAQEMSLEAARHEIVYQIMQLFYTAAGLQRVIQAAERAVSLAGQRIGNAQNRKAQGAEGEITVLRAQSEQDKAEQDLERARLAQQQLLMALGALLDLPTPQTLTAPEELTVPQATTDELLQQALRDRPDVLARRRSVGALDTQVTEAQWRWLPFVTANFTGRYTDTPGFVGKNWLWSVTGNLVIPLFDRGQRYAEARERAQVGARLRSELDRAELDTRSAILQTRAEIETSRRTLQLATGAAQKAKRTAEIMGKAQSAGAATSLEVAEADTGLRLADVSVERERINLSLAILKLQHLIGAIRPR